MTNQLTLAEALDNAFELYVSELLDSRAHCAYLGTLHLACSVPDICGALQSADGESNGHRYIAWVDRHLVKGDHVMAAADWYKMRCAVLHQGSSLPIDTKSRLKSQYASISFVTPSDSDLRAHRVVVRTLEGPNITINIAQLADEVLAGLRDWFVWLHQPEADTERPYVLKRLRTIISPRWKMWPEIPNPGITWSSSGATPILTMDFP